MILRCLRMVQGTWARKGFDYYVFQTVQGGRFYLPEGAMFEIANGRRMNDRSPPFSTSKKSMTVLPHNRAILMSLVVGALTALATATHAQTRRHTCEGEFGTGSGLAGSYIGDVCRIASGTEEEAAVQNACGQGSKCRVTAEIRESDSFLMVEKVVSAEETSPPPPGPTYVERVGEHIDGVLAPLPAGCSKAQKPADRVSILLGAPIGGPTVQMKGEYCAVTNAVGDEPTNGKLKATLQANCGADAEDAELRKGAGRQISITLTKDRDGVPVIDGVQYARCPITRAATPAWWIDRQPIFEGLTLE